jgi:carboxymethylenebutenolidase
VLASVGIGAVALGLVQSSKHYAGNDDRIDAGIPAYREALDKAGVKYELYIYEGTQHAFNNNTSAARYNKAAADLAWSRTVALFKEMLA